MPLSLLVASTAVPVSLLESLILAAGITRPAGSNTVPVMLPVSNCPQAREAHNNSADTAIAKDEFRMFVPEKSSISKAYVNRMNTIRTTWHGNVNCDEYSDLK